MVKARNPRSVLTWLRKLDHKNILQDENWCAKNRLNLGAKLIEILLSIPGSPIISGHTYVAKNKTVRTLDFDPEFKQKYLEDFRSSAHAKPMLSAMLMPPVPWSWDGDKFVGGYLFDDFENRGPSIGSARFGKGGSKELTPQNVSDVSLNALNHIQSTGWRVNLLVLDVVQKVFDSWEKYADILDVPPLIALDPDVPAEDWVRMSKDEKRKIKTKRAETHSSNFKSMSKRQSLLEIRAAAEQDASETALYFPHAFDWRRRVYPVTHQFHPQSCDLARGLLEFSSGVPLGTAGYSWLVFHLANCAGQDKLSQTQKAKWFNDNLDEIWEVASDPLGAGLEMFRSAEDPWQFLAACIEVCSVGDDPENFVSHLPVNVDGTCNGLQHMSAMGRDPEGARATNLTANDERQDIYQIVSDKVKNKVDWDCASGYSDDPCWYWSDKVSRKVVKRGVMTLPYGLTDIGRRDQLIKDGWTRDGKQATYLSNLMADATDETVQSAALIMEWLQFNAGVLADFDLPIRWHTPDGSVIEQEYRALPMRRIVTNLGSLQIYDDAKRGTGALLKNKQKLGIVPNLIHSFDAAHLFMTLKLLPKDMSISVVHDSFGTHAGNMPILLGALKRSFCDIYKKDWLARLQRDFQEQVPKGVQLRPAPALGDWQPEEVLESEFFFS